MKSAGPWRQSIWRSKHNSLFNWINQHRHQLDKQHSEGQTIFLQRSHSRCLDNIQLPSLEDEYSAHARRARQGHEAEWGNIRLEKTGKHDIGLIAEDVGQVVPEVVKYEENGVDAQSVDYARLTALLIEAVKEQQKTIDELKSELDDLKAQPNIRALTVPGK